MEKLKDLKTRFNEEIVPKLQKTLGAKNKIAVPVVKKITLNVGIGTYVKSQNKDYSNIVENIAKISGQKPTLRKSKKSISNFKTRKNEVIGISVTLRGQKMYDFLNKLVNIVFPRVRDFRGISKKSFDGKGNCSLGFKEHTVFPEINPEDILKMHGVEVSITTTAKTDTEGYELLKAIGFPFKKQ